MAVPLPVGLASFPYTAFGTGPAGQPHHYTSAGLILDPLTAVAAIAAGDANNMVMFTSLADSYNNWSDQQGTTNTWLFNMTKYTNQLKRWTVAGGASPALADAISSALNRRRIILYLMDEPYHQRFGGSIPNNVVNQVGLLAKSLWPGCLTVVRADSFSLSPAPQGGWSGLDYGWAQYEGPHVPSAWGAIGRAQETSQDFFRRERNDFLTLDLGMIAGVNIWDGGFYNNFGGLNACWDYLNTGSSSGYIIASSYRLGSHNPGQGIPCGTRDTGPPATPTVESRFVSSPAHIMASIDGLFADAATLADTPAIQFWGHNVSASATTYEARSDFAAAIEYVLAKALTRPSWNGWRPAKGASAPPPGPVGSQYTYAESLTRVTMTSDTYGDLPPVLPSTDFTAGSQYLVIAKADIDYGSANQNAYCRLMHGSVPFVASEHCWQPEGTAERMPYLYWTVWTAVAGESIKMQVRNETGQVLTLGAEQMSLFALNLTALPANTWFYNDNTSSTALSGAYADGASITFTPPVAAHDWWILSNAYYLTPSLTQSLFSLIDRSGEAVSSDPECSIEGEDALDQYIMCNSRVQSLGNASNTFKERSKNGGGGGPRTNSKIFALDLNTFAAHGFAYTAAELDYASGALFNTQAQTANITTTASSPVYVFGSHNWIAGVLGISLNSRLQIANVDTPAGQTAAGRGFQTTHDALDIPPVQHQAVKSLAAGTYAIDLDGSQGSAAAGRGGKGRLVLGLQLGTTITTPPTWTAIPDKVVEANALLDFTVVASDAVVAEPSLVYSVVNLLPPGANFDALTRRFTWTPTVLQISDTAYAVTLRVSNGTNSADITFNISVVDPAEAPAGETPYDSLKNLRYDASVVGGRLHIRVSWNSGGSFLSGAIKAGISGIVVEMSDLGRY